MNLRSDILVSKFAFSNLTCTDTAWHAQITAFLGKLVGVARELSNADIIAVLNWYRSYAVRAVQVESS